MATKDERTFQPPEYNGVPTWEAIDAFLDEALEQPIETRTEWVRANAPDASIANQVLLLLAAAEKKGVLDAEIPADFVTPEGSKHVRARLAEALDGRYRIDGVLGEGGTATVFLAHETKHDRAVVLKVLRPEAAVWIGAERFLNEIQILAQLSHPHILALIDSGQADGLLYYVMPYVGGETLRERLGRGALSTTEALPLLRDIAAALAHAHSQRLIHRDLKPDNILIVSGHAFLMDFGIAKLGTQIARPGATIEGVAVGTPQYMAPEQASGFNVDARADVYSWAVVASELLSGQIGPLSEIPPSVPPELRRLIARCLQTQPAKRPVDGSELLEHIDAITTREPRPRRRSFRAITAVTVVLVAVVALLTTFRSRRPALASVAGPVAVVPLTNETGDSSLAVWGRMAGDWLTQGLHETGRVAVVPWPVALQASAAMRDRAGDPVRALAGETGAQTVVTGAYYLNAGAIRFQAQVTDARNGAVLAALPAIDVPRDSVRAGIQQLRDRLMAVFAIGTDQRLSSVPGLIDAPPTYEAYRLFERGIDRFNALDYKTATNAFLDAWRRDTSFVIPLVYAAMSYLNASDDQRADSLVKALRSRAARLNPYHELTLRYTEASLAGDAKQALELARQAAAMAPGGRAQYSLGSMALSVGQANEALATLRSMDPDKGVLKGWAPYWHVLTHAEHLVGDFQGELKTTEELRRRYPDSRAGWVHHVRVLAALGKTAAVDSVFASAAALPPDTYWSQGAMLVIAGEELEAHGHPGAQRYYQRAVTWLANQLARDPSHRAHRYWMGSVQLDRGAPRDAEPYFESLVHDFPTDISFRGLWGVTAAFAGDSALARRRLADAPAYRRGEHLTYLARYAAIAGDKERAIALWSEAVAAGFNGFVWIHASARRDVAPLMNDPRFRRLGIIPGSRPAE